jgi:5-methylcytosine-specific restriction enzyme A
MPIQVPIDKESDFEYESYSWKMVSDNVIVKRMDKSSFLHHGTGIPVTIRSFFNIDSMKVGEKRPIILTHGIIDYVAYFQVVNEENPRSRLIWRSDLQRLIQEKFPYWTNYFQNLTKHEDTTPNLKIVKTKSDQKFLIFFEDIKKFEGIKKSSDSLELMKVYSREELKNKYRINDATIKNGIFKPKDIPSVWLFITEEKTRDRTQYVDLFDGQTLQFEGQTKGRTDGLIINHENDGNEIILFYRKKKREFPNYGFRYLGQFYYHSHTPRKLFGEPTRFILYPLDVMQDDDKGELVDIEPYHPTITEGKEKTRIQTYLERNPKLRKQAIKIHGTTCVVCNFNFAEKYGKFGEGYIEIHHLEPLASVKGERDVDPKTDLVPICSNCHRMIHKPDPMLTVQELENIIP